MDSEDKPRLWANAGEAIVCIKGHPICSIAHDIYDGDVRSGKDFTNWQQPEPDRSTSVARIRCAVCRGSWIKGNKRDGYQFHFAEGWR